MKRSLVISLATAAVLYGVFLATTPGRAEPAAMSVAPLTGLSALPEIVDDCSLDAPAAAEASALKAVLPAAKDSYVRQTAPGSNFGNATLLKSGRSLSPADEYHTLIQFDLSGLPANAVIVTATLELYSPLTTTGHRVHAVLGAWDELTVTWSSAPAYTSTYIASANSGPGFKRWNVTAIAQQWKTGTLANRGLMIQQGGTVFGIADFVSQEGFPNTPRLTIEYVTQGSPAILPVQADTWINQALPSTNYGNETTVSIGRVSTNARNGLLKFDLSSLPGSTVVISAALEMYYDVNLSLPEGARGVADVWTDAVLSPWSEMTVTWNTRPVTQAVGDPASGITPGWNRWDVSNLVRHWVSGTILNNGLQLRLDPGATPAAHDLVAQPDAYAARLVVAYHTCNRPLTGIGINGATQGLTGTTYTFAAVPAPTSPTTPVTYTWKVSDRICGVHPFPPCDTGTRADYSFTAIGVKTVTLVAKNCGGTFTTTHQINIVTPTITCPAPIVNLGVVGPSKGLTGTTYAFTATASPGNATTPITFTWRATDKAAVTTTGSLTQTGRTWSWSALGSKLITVTAENCGGIAEYVLAIDIVPASQMADLVVTSGWYDAPAQKVGYILRNIGGEAIEPSPNFAVNLYRNEALMAQGLFSDTLIPGAIRSGTVDFHWQCVGITGTVRLMADGDLAIGEGNEGNNNWSEVWPCDLDYPSVTDGPVVVATYEHSATLRFITNEQTQRTIRYGTNSGVYPNAVSDSTPRFSHIVTITGLAAERVYHYAIVITDTRGNVGNTRDYLFETKAACSDSPVLSNLSLTPWTHPFYEFYAVSASVADPACVDSVAFTLDGTPIGTDYTPVAGASSYSITFSPRDAGFTRAGFFKSLNLKATATSKKGVVTTQTQVVAPDPRPTPGDIEILEPEADYTVYVAGATAPPGTQLPIVVRASEFEWACAWSGFSDGLPPELSALNCRDVDKAPDNLTFQLSGGVAASRYPAGHEYTYTLDLGSKATGDYTLTACVRKAITDLDCAALPIHIVQGSPELNVLRKVTRAGSSFDVELIVRNLGPIDAKVDRIDDNLRGFQSSDRSIAAWTYPRSAYQPATKRTTVILALTGFEGAPVTIAAGGIYTAAYRIAPILFEAAPAYAIGGDPLSVCYTPDEPGASRSCKSFARAATNVRDASSGASELVGQAVANAFAASDYVLVTNPGRLNNFYDDLEVPPVLETMARLATLKNGVLGFLSSYDGHVLDDLVEKDGAWKQALHPNFFVKNKGFMLLVGENEIIQAFRMGSSHFTTYPGIPDVVDNSDLPYANTAGETARPEIVLGRIVGDDPATLRQGMLGSIGVAENWWNAEFDRSHALLVSGRGEGVTSNFIPTVNIIEGELVADGVSVAAIHEYDVNDGNYWGPFAALTPDRDVLFYRDHGNTDWWGDTLASSWVEDIDSGHTRPVAFAAACLAGNYAGDNDDNMPEAWMRKEAGVYIGSTELSERSTNDYASKYFFRNWNADESAGVALNNAKIAAWDDDGSYDNGKLWAFEYQLYGDPKFGALVGALGPQTGKQALQPLTPSATVQVHIPDYVIESRDGYDVVTLPGGLLRLEPGRFEIPYWEVRVDYPQGTRVGEVALSALSSPVVTTGLHLMTVTHQTDCIGCPVLPAPPLLDTAGWAPPLDPKYAWEAETNGDGSTTLILKVFPFFYNVLSTDAQFYPDFTFEVETYPAPLSIISFKTDKDTLPLNGDVTLSLALANTGAPTDTVVSAALRQIGNNDLVAGLPLKAVHGLSGTALLDLVWNSAGVPAGNYQLVVDLLDSEGTVQDSAASELTVGVLQGELESLTAARTSFKPGQYVTITLVFSNTGDVPIQGLTWIKIYPADSMTPTAVFSQTISPPGLQPGQAMTFSAVWNTTGLSTGAYRILGYAQYANLVSDAKEIVVVAPAGVFMPRVVR